MRAINDDEREVGEVILSGEYDNLAIVSTELDGQEGACIAAITMVEDDEVLVTPLALLLTGEIGEALFPRMVDPASV